MTTRVDALANPPLLKWAREAAGFDITTAAKKASVREERLRSWEEGERHPTINQLRTLARVYKRPIAVFYLPEAPPIPDLPKDFRRLPGKVSGIESPELRFEIRRAIMRREIALDLIEQEGEEPPNFGGLTATTQDPPDEIGQSIRESLNVSLDSQFSWRGPYEPFNGWKDAIEASGVLVMQMTEVEVDEARGFSVSDFPLPVVITNIKDPPNPRTFSLLHELAHVVIRQGGLCDLDDVTNRGRAELNIERMCNAVAGAALVPRNQFLSEEIVREHESAEWTDDELQSLARKYGVSREVVLRRLFDLGKTSQGFYRDKREELIEQFKQRSRRSEGFAPPHQVALAAAGSAFTGLVMSSYAHGTITASDVSDYLGVRLKHLPRIEERLVSRGRKG